MTTGRVFDVQRFSTHDGPGIRTTVFLKGCPLGCRWCQNPEGMDATIRLWAFDTLCDGCGACLGSCASGALRLEKATVLVDQSRCTACGDCVNACPRNAVTLDGRTVTVDELLAELARDRVFHDVSGGGVTFSGGEPLAQAAFVHEVAGRLKERGVHTAVETSLLAPWSVLEPLLAVIDAFIVDVKVADAERHLALTGVRNGTILRNLAALAARLRGTDRLLVRVPLIPGCTADDDNLRAIGNLVAGVDPSIPVELMNYNPLAEAKYRRMHREHQVGPAAEYPPDELRNFAAVVAGTGLTVRH